MATRNPSITPNVQANVDVDAYKSRIIRHMNKDHAESLSLYLEHYAKLSRSAASGATLADLDWTSLTIRTSTGRQCIIPIDPPMHSWADARLRTVAMDAECRRALNVPSSSATHAAPTHVRVTRYLGPQAAGQSAFLAFCLFFLNLFLARAFGFLDPGTYAYTHLLPAWPFGSSRQARADNFLWAADRGALFALVAHVIETVALDVRRLQRHGVARGSGVWWAWILDCMVEGGGSWVRFDGEVRRLEEHR